MRNVGILCVLAAAVLATAIPAQDATLTDYQKGEAAYKAADQLGRDRKYDEAIAAFTELIAETPQHDLADNARYRIAESLLQQRRYEEAVAAYRKLLTDYPKSEQRMAAMTRLVPALKNNLRRYDEAIVVAETLATQFPGYNGAETYRWEVIDCLWRTKDYEACRKAAQAYVDSPLSDGARRLQAVEMIARCCVELDDAPGVEAAMKEIAAKDDGLYYQSYAHRNLANTYRAKRDYAKAAEHYIAAAAGKSYPYAQSDLWSGAEALRSAKQYEQAITAYRDITVRYPQGAYAHSALLSISDCHGSLRDYEKKVAACRELVETHPDSIYLAPALYRMAQGYAGMKDYDGMLATCAQVYEKLPESPYADDALWLAAERLRVQKDAEGAKALYERLAADYANCRYGDIARTRLAAK